MRDIEELLQALSVQSYPDARDAHSATAFTPVDGVMAGLFSVSCFGHEWPIALKKEGISR